MDYSFTDEQKQIVEAARKFAINEFPKVARECDREEKFPMEIWKKAGELGFMGIFISSEYGGLGLGWKDCMLRGNNYYWRQYQYITHLYMPCRFHCSHVI